MDCFSLLFRAFPVLLIAGLTQAQQPLSDSLSGSLQEVTVTAARLPVRATESALAITRIDSAAIRSGQLQRSLAESLGAVPGLFVQNDANFAQDLRIAVRGFGARAAFGIRGIKVLLDGIPESAPDGQAQVDNLDMAAVNRIEVLRGASGGLYGNASGGVLSLESDPVPTQPALHLRLAGGAFGFRQLHARGGATLGKQGFSLALTHLGLDGYREHAALRSTLANGRWTWIPDSSTRLSILINYVDSPRADDPGALTSEQVAANRRAANANNVRFRAGESVQQGRAGLVWEKNWARQRRLRMRAYSVWRDFENRLPLLNGGQVAFQRWFAGGGGQYEWGQGPWRFTAGFDIDRQADDRQRYDNPDGLRGVQNLNQLEQFTGAGAYALAVWKPWPAWTVSGGARFDWVQLTVTDRFETDGLQSGEKNYRRASPWGGVVLRLLPGLQAYGNITTNFETPTLNELSNNPANTGGFNAALTPQRALSGEAGLRGQWPLSLRWEIAAFYTRVRDELTPYELPDFPGRTFYRNAGETARQGLEFSAGWFPLRGVQLTAAFTLAKFQYVTFETPGGDFAGRQLPGLPRQWGTLELRYTHRGGFYGSGQLRYTGRFFADDANARAVEPYALIHLRAGYRRTFQHFSGEIFLGADNIAGAVYFNNIRPNAAGGRYYEPGARQTVFGGMGVRI